MKTQKAVRGGVSFRNVVETFSHLRLWKRALRHLHWRLRTGEAASAHSMWHQDWASKAQAVDWQSLRSQLSKSTHICLRAGAHKRKRTHTLSAFCTHWHSIVIFFHIFLTTNSEMQYAKHVFIAYIEKYMQKRTEAFTLHLNTEQKTLHPSERKSGLFWPVSAKWLAFLWLGLIKVTCCLCLSWKPTTHKLTHIITMLNFEGGKRRQKKLPHFYESHSVKLVEDKSHSPQLGKR